MLRTALALALATIVPAAAKAADQGQVMVLGTHHLANNNRDLINLPIEDITTPARQSEIIRMIDALALWKPTRVVVEWSYADQAGLGSGLVDHSQKMTVAARATAEKKAVGQRS